MMKIAQLGPVRVRKMCVYWIIKRWDREQWDAQAKYVEASGKCSPTISIGPLSYLTCGCWELNKISRWMLLMPLHVAWFFIRFRVILAITYLLNELITPTNLRSVAVHRNRYTEYGYITELITTIHCIWFEGHYSWIRWICLKYVAVEVCICVQEFDSLYPTMHNTTNHENCYYDNIVRAACSHVQFIQDFASLSTSNVIWSTKHDMERLECSFQFNHNEWCTRLQKPLFVHLPKYIHWKKKQNRKSNLQIALICFYRRTSLLCVHIADILPIKYVYNWSIRVENFTLPFSYRICAVFGQCSIHDSGLTFIQLTDDVWCWYCCLGFGVHNLPNLLFNGNRFSRRTVQCTAYSHNMRHSKHFKYPIYSDLKTNAH